MNKENYFYWHEMIVDNPLHSYTKSDNPNTQTNIENNLENEDRDNCCIRCLFCLYICECIMFSL